MPPPSSCSATPSRSRCGAIINAWQECRAGCGGVEHWHVLGCTPGFEGCQAGTAQQCAVGGWRGVLRAICSSPLPPFLPTASYLLDTPTPTPTHISLITTSPLHVPIAPCRICWARPSRWRACLPTPRSSAWEARARETSPRPSEADLREPSALECQAWRGGSAAHAALPRQHRRRGPTT